MFATRIAPRTDATTKDTKSTKKEFAENWNHVIRSAIAAYQHLRAELLETTGSIWKTVGHDLFFESFVLFVSFVVDVSRRLRGTSLRMANDRGEQGGQRESPMTRELKSSLHGDGPVTAERY